jgi:GNAT superfamily N-acetyltransferase
MFEAQTVHIESAETPELLNAVRELFVEYAESLDVDLCFQNFAEELAGLPGEYARPAGRLLLAGEDGQAVGCGALRCAGEGICEMKRLYVRPTGRGKGVGLALIDALVKEAREIASYRYNSIAGSLFLELDLTMRAEQGDRL